MEPTKFYELIGMFCIKFEHVCLNLEDLFESVLKAEGKDADAISMELDSLTARPLEKMLIKEIRKLSKTTAAEREQASNAECVLQSFSSLKHLRNLLLHTKWIEPHSDPLYRPQHGLVLGRKIKAKRNQQKDATLYPALDVERLEKSVEACCEIEFLIGILGYWLFHKNASEANPSKFVDRARAVNAEVTLLLSSIKRI
ncbi:hypothetical protein [Xanthomonas euroxanthea]|uniref:Uncharacterized protein n=1 Tax=Xanthomonas euroxanthea TaxID=2259622 RepID=A0AA46C7K7_9XANT|nr:hypothetical protein [Xanthomonas euroxanthea]CAE1135335.1 hypothetical protein XTG_001661 [Xanthomonas euroxanthea]SUZ27885.1 hypothetical protein CPBF424_16810 [Xanthomonas euroxanthea]